MAGETRTAKPAMLSSAERTAIAPRWAGANRRVDCVSMCFLAQSPRRTGATKLSFTRQPVCRIPADGETPPGRAREDGQAGMGGAVDPGKLPASEPGGKGCFRRRLPVDKYNVRSAILAPGIQVVRAAARQRTETSWLDSWHCFSFG